MLAEGSRLPNLCLTFNVSIVVSRIGDTNKSEPPQLASVPTYWPVSWPTLSWPAGHASNSTFCLLESRLADDARLVTCTFIPASISLGSLVRATLFLILFEALGYLVITPKFG